MQNLNIVIVEDEEYILRGIESKLVRSGKNYKVVGCYENGLEALQKIDYETVDVLITDIKMPKLSGLDLIKVLREKKPQLQCIILSGFNDFEYARTAIQYGVLDYLIKPLDKDQLFALLDRVYADKIQELKENVQGKVSKNEKKVVQVIKKIIESEYQNELDLKRISDTVYLHPNYLSKLFKIETGESITSYLIGFRINKARALLKNKLDLKVYEVGDMVGYPDPVYFAKIFKRVTGITPKEYKDIVE
jgi:two-component system, response regulator YesN